MINRRFPHQYTPHTSVTHVHALYDTTALHVHHATPASVTPTARYAVTDWAAHQPAEWSWRVSDPTAHITAPDAVCPHSADLATLQLTTWLAAPRSMHGMERLSDSSGMQVDPTE